jgi:hypothetical protein
MILTINTKLITHNTKLHYICSVFYFGKTAKPVYLNKNDD